ncbi:MAG: hypothetical protein WA708_07400 [Acidobacteriaceae bacterium]
MQDLATILRDPMVRTILAIAAICLTVSFFLIGRRRKRLSYLLSDTRVLGIHEEVNPSRVQILFDGEPVTEVHLVIITVNNWGNEPIRVDDFVRPLRFSWTAPAKLLAAEVIEVNPETLQPTIKAGVSEIVVDPLLLNPGDWLRIRTLINQVGELSVDARVIGVKRITKISASEKATSARMLRLMAIMGALATGTILLMSAGRGLGLWVASGRAEERITLAFVVTMLVLVVDGLKASVLDLISYFKDKNGLK